MSIGSNVIPKLSESVVCAWDWVNDRRRATEVPRVRGKRYQARYDHLVPRKVRMKSRLCMLVKRILLPNRLVKNGRQNLTNGLSGPGTAGHRARSQCPTSGYHRVAPSGRGD